MFVKINIIEKLMLKICYPKFKDNFSIVYREEERKIVSLQYHLKYKPQQKMHFSFTTITIVNFLFSLCNFKT